MQIQTWFHASLSQGGMKPRFEFRPTYEGMANVPQCSAVQVLRSAASFCCVPQCSWTAAEVSSFLEQADLSGPAAHLFANGCNGADLFKATSSTLTSELRLTLFAASKVLAAREAFLR